MCSTALSLPNSAPAAESFFRSNFTPWGVEIPAKKGRTSTGLMTGYYEPLLYGSRVRQPPYVHPIYGIPDNLLTIDLGELYPDLKGRRLRGKLDGRRVVPYDKRGAIQEKEAEMARWAIAWVSDPVDAFFLHVQGSGRIVLPDGSFMRVGFADQNGWRYHSIGQWLITHEHLSAHELSMQRFRSWAKANPSKVKAALAQNPSYIFFEERKSDTELGPIGAAGVPLTPEASVAVDQKFWKLGTPFIVSISQERPALAFTLAVPFKELFALTTSGDSAMTPALQLDGKRALLLPGFWFPMVWLPRKCSPTAPMHHVKLYVNNAPLRIIPWRRFFERFRSISFRSSVVRLGCLQIVQPKQLPSCGRRLGKKMSARRRCCSARQA